MTISSSLPLPSSPHPHISHFPLHNTCVLLSLSAEPSMIPLTFLAYTVTPGFLLTSKDSELETNKREHAAFAFQGLGYLTQNRIFQFHLFTCKLHNSIFLYSWMAFHCVNAPHSHYPFISWRTYRLFPFYKYCEQGKLSRRQQKAYIFIFPDKSFYFWRENNKVRKQGGSSFIK